MTQRRCRPLSLSPPPGAGVAGDSRHFLPVPARGHNRRGHQTVLGLPGAPRGRRAPLPPLHHRRLVRRLCPCTISAPDATAAAPPPPPHLAHPALCPCASPLGRPLVTLPPLPHPFGRRTTTAPPTCASPATCCATSPPSSRPSSTFTTAPLSEPRCARWLPTPLHPAPGPALRVIASAVSPPLWPPPPWPPPPPPRHHRDHQRHHPHTTTSSVTCTANHAHPPPPPPTSPPRGTYVSDAQLGARQPLGHRPSLPAPQRRAARALRRRHRGH